MRRRPITERSACMADCSAGATWGPERCVHALRRRTAALINDLQAWRRKHGQDTLTRWNHPDLAIYRSPVFRPLLNGNLAYLQQDFGV
jgi:hypothetical protein